MDQSFIDKIVQEVKSQGLFDEFRKECMADVDTKPAYQNLQQRVQSSVKAFLDQQTWTPDLNMNQLRERLRKHIVESTFFDKGVDRLVDQVVDPKVNTTFQHRIEELAYNYLGVPRPSFTVKAESAQRPIYPPLPPLPPMNGPPFPLKVEPPPDILPNDLEQISPDSDRISCLDDKADMEEDNLSVDMELEDKADDDSPPFEPLEKNRSIADTEANNINSVPEENALKFSYSKNLSVEPDYPYDGNNYYKKMPASRSFDAINSQESQGLSRISSDSRISTHSQHNTNEALVTSKNMKNTEHTVNISEEAQMPKFSDKSNECYKKTAGRSSGALHFDINKEEFKFEGTERKVNMSPSETEKDAYGKLDVTMSLKMSSFKISSGPVRKNELHIQEHSLVSSVEDSLSAQLCIVEQSKSESTSMLQAEHKSMQVASTPNAYSPAMVSPAQLIPQRSSRENSVRTTTSSSSTHGHKKHSREKDRRPRSREKDSHSKHKRKDRSRTRSRDRDKHRRDRGKSRDREKNGKHKGHHDSSSKAREKEKYSNHNRDRDRDRYRNHEKSRSKHHSSSSSKHSSSYHKSNSASAKKEKDENISKPLYSLSPSSISSSSRSEPKSRSHENDKRESQSKYSSHKSDEIKEYKSSEKRRKSEDKKFNYKDVEKVDDVKREESRAEYQEKLGIRVHNDSIADRDILYRSSQSTNDINQRGFRTPSVNSDEWSETKPKEESSFHWSASVFDNGDSKNRIITDDNVDCFPKREITCPKYELQPKPTNGDDDRGIMDSSKKEYNARKSDDYYSRSKNSFKHDREFSNDIKVVTSSDILSAHGSSIKNTESTYKIQNDGKKETISSQKLSPDFSDEIQISGDKMKIKTNGREAMILETDAKVHDTSTGCSKYSRTKNDPRLFSFGNYNESKVTKLGRVPTYASEERAEFKSTDFNDYNVNLSSTKEKVMSNEFNINNDNIEKNQSNLTLPTVQNDFYDLDYEKRRQILGNHSKEIAKTVFDNKSDYKSTEISSHNGDVVELNKNVISKSRYSNSSADDLNDLKSKDGRCISTDSCKGSPKSACDKKTEFPLFTLNKGNIDTSGSDIKINKNKSEKRSSTDIYNNKPKKAKFLEEIDSFASSRNHEKHRYRHKPTDNLSRSHSKETKDRKVQKTSYEDKHNESFDKKSYEKSDKRDRDRSKNGSKSKDKREHSSSNARDDHHEIKGKKLRRKSNDSNEDKDKSFRSDKRELLVPRESTTVKSSTDKKTDRKSSQGSGSKSDAKDAPNNAAHDENSNKISHNAVQMKNIYHISEELQNPDNYFDFGRFSSPNNIHKIKDRLEKSKSGALTENKTNFHSKTSSLSSKPKINGKVFDGKGGVHDIDSINDGTYSSDTGYFEEKTNEQKNMSDEYESSDEGDYLSYFDEEVTNRIGERLKLLRRIYKTGSDSSQYEICSNFAEWSSGVANNKLLTERGSATFIQKHDNNIASGAVEVVKSNPNSIQYKHRKSLGDKIFPTPSDSSGNSKENKIINYVRSSYVVESKSSYCQQQRRDHSLNRKKLSQQQRYTSEDLYKPRPILGQRSRRRGMDPII